MKIDFQKIITNSGQPLTAKDIFKNQVSAYNMIQFHERGEAKSIDIDYELLQYLMERWSANVLQCQTPSTDQQKRK